jgi:hypothetical protein
VGAQVGGGASRRARGPGLVCGIGTTGSSGRAARASRRASVAAWISSNCRSFRNSRTAAKSLSLLTRPLLHTSAGGTRACACGCVAEHDLGAHPTLECAALLYKGGNVLEVPAGADAETATLVWLMGALEWAREGGHERLAGYLEAVADDVVFEAEAAARTS